MKRLFPQPVRGRSGQVSDSSVSVSFVPYENVANNIGAFETNGELSARAGVVGAGEVARHSGAIARMLSG